MKNIKQLFNSMGLLATPSNLDLFIDSVDEALYELRLQKIQRIPEGESFGTAMARKYRPTTNSQEEEFAEEQREVEREAAETESANTNEMIQRLKVIESLRQGSLPPEYEEELIEEEGQIIEALNESGEKWKPEVGERYWLACPNAAENEVYVWYRHEQDSGIAVDWYSQNRIRKTSEEAFERSKELNREREAAETESPDLGKGGNVIQPAPPLREMPDSKYAEFYVSFPGSGVDNVPMKMECSQAYLFLESGRLFPPTEAGKLGAELRAKQGILPPIDREGHGVFVPESLIKDFARATENAWIDGDFKDCYHEVENFLKAIEKGGQNE